MPLAHRAAAAGDMEILSQSIQSDPTILEHQDADGRDLWHFLLTWPFPKQKIIR